MAARVLERIKGVGDCVVDSIRNNAEACRLRDNGVVLWSVRAPARVRFRRLVRRGREGEPQTYEAFLASERTENRADDPDGLQVGAVEQQADVVIENDGTPAALRERVRAAMAEVRNEQ